MTDTEDDRLNRPMPMAEDIVEATAMHIWNSLGPNFRVPPEFATKLFHELPEQVQKAIRETAQHILGLTMIAMKNNPRQCWKQIDDWLSVNDLEAAPKRSIIVPGPGDLIN